MRKSPAECRAGGRTGSVVRQENEREDEGEGVQNSGKISTDVRAEAWALKKAQENKLEVAEMRQRTWTRSDMKE